MQSSYRAFSAPQPVLQDLTESELCNLSLVGFTSSCKGNCPLPSHQIFRVTGTEDDHRPIRLPFVQNTLSTAKRLKSKDPFDHDGAGKYCDTGPRHDNDFESIRDIKILPTTDEILCTKRPYMPLNHRSALGHLDHGTPRYFDIQFRHLREDNVRPIIHSFYDAAQIAVQLSEKPQDSRIDYRRETPTGTRYNFFTRAKFENVGFADKHGAVFQLSYDCPKDLRRTAMGTSSVLEEGKLCGLLAIHKKSEQVNIVLCTTYQRESTETMKFKTGNHERASVRLALTDPDDTGKVREMAYYAQNIYDDVKLFLVDLSSILPVSFVLHLDRLQKLSISEDFAFRDKLAPKDPLEHFALEAPTHEKGFKYNLNCLKKDPANDLEDFCMTPHSIDVSNTSYQPSQPRLSQEDKKTIEQLKERTTLDEGQATALFEALNRDLPLIQGPPGTGKSYLGVKLCGVIQKSRVTDDNSPVVVVCMTNHAVDDFVGGLVANGCDKIVRLGSRGAPSVAQFTLRSKRTKSRCSALESRLYGEAKAQMNSHWAQGIELAEALASSTTEVKWAAIKDYLASFEPEAYKHFLDIEKIIPNSYDLRRVRRAGFAFIYWLEGGDLNDDKSLEHQFDKLMVSCDPDLEEDAIKRAREQVSKAIASNVEKVALSGQCSWLWDLDVPARKELAAHWSSDFDPRTLCDTFAEVHRRYQIAVENGRKASRVSDRLTIQRNQTDYIALTSTGFARNWELLNSLGPKVILFEEASELVEAHSTVCMLPTITHAIKIGDPKQLRPHVQQTVLDKDHDDRYRLNESLFERLIEQDQTAYSVLNVQRRAHPEIASLLRVGDYPFLKDHPSTYRRPIVSGMKQRMFWLDHQNPEDVPDPQSPFSKSSSNTYEAKLVAAFVKYFVLAQGYKFGDITVLTPYQGQIALLQKEMSGVCDLSLTEADRNALIDAGLLSDEEVTNGTKVEVALSSMLRIATVDNYQGEQSKIIIFSAVRSNPRNMAGFLNNQNRINVAISRAEDGFYVVGNANLMSRIQHWNKILKAFMKKKALGRALTTCCPRHATHTFSVQSGSQLDKIPTCITLCYRILKCGHLCKEKCHALEMHDDGRLVCQEECVKKLPCGHKCMKACGAPCGGQCPCSEAYTPVCGTNLKVTTIEPMRACIAA